MFQRILVPLDGSTTSLLGLDEALRLARLTGAKLRLVHVVDELKYVTGFEAFAARSSDLLTLMEEAGEQLLQQGRERALRAGVQAESVLLTSLASRTFELVVEQAKAWNADLIVIGAHGRRGIARAALGSDAEQILLSAPVPVLLVRAPHADGDAVRPRAAAASTPHVPIEA